MTVLRAMATAMPLVFAGCTDNLATATRTEAPRGLEATTIAPVTFDAVYVVNGEAASISVIDAETNTVAGTIAIRGVAYPHHVAVSPDRSTLAIAVPGFDMSGGEFGHEQHASRPGHVILLDAVTGAMKAATQIDAPNHNVAFSADGRSVWTSQGTTPGSTLVLDVNDLEMREAIPVGNAPARTVIAPDGAFAYVANSGSATVTVIDVPSRSVRATVRVGAGPVVAHPTRDGFVYVENEPDQSMSVINRTTLQVERTLPLGYHPGSVTTGPDGAVWITAPIAGRVEVRSGDGALLRAVDSGRGANDVLFSADGTRAYVSNELEDTVSVIEIATMRVTAKIPVGAKPNGMGWRSK